MEKRDWLEMVMRNPETFKDVPAGEQTHEICMAAVTRNGWLLRAVFKQTPEICIAAVEESGMALAFVREQTPDICMAAVQQDGFALQFVKKQTPELCLAAVKENGHALKYAEHQLPSVCHAAVRENPCALCHVHEMNKTRELCYDALKSINGNDAIPYVPDHIKDELAEYYAEQKEKAEAQARRQNRKDILTNN